MNRSEGLCDVCSVLSLCEVDHELPMEVVGAARAPFELALGVGDGWR